MNIIIKCEILAKYAILAKNSITVHRFMPRAFCHMLLFECLFHLGMKSNKSRHIISRIYAVEVIPIQDGSCTSFEVM